MLFVIIKRCTICNQQYKCGKNIGRWKCRVERNDHYSEATKKDDTQLFILPLFIVDHEKLDIHPNAIVKKESDKPIPYYLVARSLEQAEEYRKTHSVI